MGSNLPGGSFRARLDRGTNLRKSILEISDLLSTTLGFFLFPIYLSDMASHDPVTGSADLLANQGEGDRAEIKSQDDAALLVSGASRPFFCKSQIN